MAPNGNSAVDHPLAKLRDALRDSFPTPKVFATELYLQLGGFKLGDAVELAGGESAVYGAAVAYFADQGGDFLEQVVVAAVRAAPLSQKLRDAASAMGFAVEPSSLPTEAPKQTVIGGIASRIGLGPKLPPPTAVAPDKRRISRTIRLRVRLVESGRTLRVEAEKLRDGLPDGNGEPASAAGPLPKGLIAEVAKVEAAILESTLTRGVSAPTAARAVNDDLKELGKSILELVLPGPVLKLYRNCQREIAGLADEEDGGRGSIVLEVDASDAPSLSAMPWELAFDGFSGGRHDHLCLFDDTPLRRTMPVPLCYRFHRSTPVRVLGMVSNPRLVGLDTSLSGRSFFEEQETIRKALDGPLARRQIDLAWVAGSSREHLKDRLRRVDESAWSVLHFIGHGTFDSSSGEGCLLLERDGEPQKVFGSDLARLAMPPGKPPPGLVVLNCCSGAQASSGLSFASIAEKLALSGIPAVVAMQFTITENAARCFSKTFYKGLAEGLTVQQALTDARSEVKQSHNAEWVTPALYMTGDDFSLVKDAA